MKRLPFTVRPNLAQRAHDLGFHYAEADGDIYWDESACYCFTLPQIEDDLEAASAELCAMCFAIVDEIVRDDRLLQKLRIPEHAWPVIAESWKRGDATLYGRFDLRYDGESPPKLLEYNADTPTALYEAAVFQWDWLEDSKAQRLLPADADQFNSIHETLIERWRIIARGKRLHFARMADSEEDVGTVAYLEDCARQAGVDTAVLAMPEIGLRDGIFTDLQERPIEQIFKLYPWEWMFADPFGHEAVLRDLRCIEPVWKSVLSNKGLLPLLWDKWPHHPNLLEARFDDGGASMGGADYVRKPLYSREGANVRIVEGGRVAAETDGTYGGEGFIRQVLSPLPDFGGNFPVVGSWIIGDKPCGIGIREDRDRITSNRSRFVPHWIEP
jgi:glutathionylspermidine synthase